MTQRIAVGDEIIEFPADMTDEQISAAIREDIASREQARIDETAPKNAVEGFFLQPARPTPESEKLTPAGAADVLGTFAATGVAVPASGLNMLSTLLRGKGVDAAVEAGRATEDAIMAGDLGALGQFDVLQSIANVEEPSAQRFLETIAEPLAALGESSDALAEGLGGGYWGTPNPLAQTILRTGAEAFIELFPGAREAKRARKALRGKEDIQNQINGSIKRIEAVADEMGVELTRTGLESGVVSAAVRMTPEQRAANMGQLQGELAAAKEASAKVRDDFYDTAREGRATVDSGSVANLADSIEADLRKFDLGAAEMEPVRNRLAELRSLGLDPADTGLILPAGAGRTRVNLSVWDDVRQRVNANMPKAGTPAYKANVLVKKKMDQWLDTEFNRLTNEYVEGGRSALDGPSDDIIAWNTARHANTIHAANFNADPVIRDLIAGGADVETYRRWIMGANWFSPKAGTRSQTVQVVKRLKDVLGEDSAAFRGLRDDYMYEVMMPLLQREPNFRQFITNYDNAVLRNPELMKTLGLNTPEFEQVYKFAELQQRLPNRQPRENLIPRLTNAIAVWKEGSGLARSALRVGFVRGVLNAVVDADPLSKKQLLHEMAGIDTTAPLILPRGRAAAEVLIGAAARDVSGARERLELSGRMPGEEEEEDK